MNSIVTEILGLIIKALRKHKKVRTSLIIILPITFITILLFYFTASVWNEAIQRGIRDFTVPMLMIVGSAILFTLVSYTKIKFSRQGIEIDLKSIREERAEIQRRITETREEEKRTREDVFDIIQLSLNQITEYYTINKSQARNSFRFSVFAIIAGLATLIGGIWIFYFGESPDINLTIISGIAGVLVEFIGGAYFYLYNKSLKQINFFYENLVKMQDTMLAIQLCESLDKKKEIEIKEKLITRLMERSSINI